MPTLENIDIPRINETTYQLINYNPKFSQVLPTSTSGGQLASNQAVQIVDITGDKPSLVEPEQTEISSLSVDADMEVVAYRPYGYTMTQDDHAFNINKISTGDGLQGINNKVITSMIRGLDTLAITGMESPNKVGLMQQDKLVSVNNTQKAVDLTSFLTAFNQAVNTLWGSYNTNLDIRILMASDLYNWLGTQFAGASGLTGINILQQSSILGNLGDNLTITTDLSNTFVLVFYNPQFVEAKMGASPRLITMSADPRNPRISYPYWEFIFGKVMIKDKGAVVAYTNVAKLTS